MAHRFRPRGPLEGEAEETPFSRMVGQRKKQNKRRPPSTCTDGRPCHRSRLLLLVSLLITLSPPVARFLSLCLSLCVFLFHFCSPSLSLSLSVYLSLQHRQLHPIDLYFVRGPTIDQMHALPLTRSSYLVLPSFLPSLVAPAGFMSVVPA